jgi:hypothetical protein
VRAHCNDTALALLLRSLACAPSDCILASRSLYPARASPAVTVLSQCRACRFFDWGREEWIQLSKCAFFVEYGFSLSPDMRVSLTRPTESPRGRMEIELDANGTSWDMLQVLCSPQVCGFCAAFGLEVVVRPRGCCHGLERVGA